MTPRFHCYVKQIQISLRKTFAFVLKTLYIQNRLMPLCLLFGSQNANRGFLSNIPLNWTISKAGENFPPQHSTCCFVFVELFAERVISQEVLVFWTLRCSLLPAVTGIRQKWRLYKRNDQSLCPCYDVKLFVPFQVKGRQGDGKLTFWQSTLEAIDTVCV